MIYHIYIVCIYLEIGNYCRVFGLQPSKSHFQSKQGSFGFKAYIDFFKFGQVRVPRSQLVAAQDFSVSASVW